MIIVDSHVHAGHSWFEPIEVLLFQMERCHVDKAELIQFAGNYDNRYLFECARRYPGRFGVVVMVDPLKPESVNAVEAWAKEGAAGLRMRVKPEERFPGPDPLALWRKASNLGLNVSVFGATLDLFASADFRKIVEEFPNLKIVMEHLAAAGKAPDMQLFDKVLALAKNPNIYIKMPGFGELLPRPVPIRTPTFEEPPKIVKMVYDAFGSRRMMWGSDYPPSANREGYNNVLNLPMKYLRFFSDEDREWVFGKTALSVWNIPE